MAYVDPTGGGILLQVLLGGSAIVMIARRLLARWVDRLLRRSDPTDDGSS